MKDKVIILGGGLTGLVVGERLQSNGFDVTIVEKNNAVGGMCRTKSHDTDDGNLLYDLGPHKFATRQKDAERYYSNMNTNSQEVDIKSHIYLNGKWLSYPVKIFEILKSFPYHGIRCGIDFMLAHLKGDGETYESYIKGRMGTHTYDFVFKDFADKIWGNPHLLDKELARTRVVTPTIFDIISGILFGDNTTFKNFKYPKYGIGDFLRDIEEKFDHADGKILLDSVLKTYDGNKVVISTPDGEQEFDNPILISTVKPRDLVIPMGLSTAAVTDLDYRDIHLFYYLVSSGKVKDTWDFFPSKDVIFNRVSRNFSSDMTHEGCDVVCVEVTSDEGEDVDEEKVFNDFTKMYDLKHRQIFDSWTEKLDGAYPIYHRGFIKDVEDILQEVEMNDKVYCIGRHACHNYNNIDHCIIEASSLAKLIVSGESPNVWEAHRDDFKWVIVD